MALLCFCFLLFLFLQYGVNTDGTEPGALTAEELTLLKKLLGEQESETSKSSNAIVERIKDIIRNESDADEFRQATESIFVGCSTNEIQCQSSTHCIIWEWECDGIVDCPDESDEVGCFECIHDPNGRLIPSYKVCDDVADCIRGEDERRCKSPCDYSEFPCDEFSVNSICIPSEWTCDAYPDCQGYRDESIELCGNLSTRCNPGEFVCGHQFFCIPHPWRCDLRDDCGDNSDEEQCGLEENKSVLEDEENRITEDSYSWGEWSDWSACNSPCDGEQIRTRRCRLGECKGTATGARSCGKGYPCMQEPSSGCGTRSFDIPTGRVLGGVDAKRNEWPWQVQIFRPERTIPFCGGSLIRRDWLLTAAHCFDKHRYPANQYTIGLARQHTSRRIKDEDAVLMRAETLILHDSYKKSSHSDDIALMELSKKIPFTPGINVVCLPNSSYDWFPDDPNLSPDCYITGFGIDEIGKRPLVLQKAHVQLIDYQTCAAHHVYGDRITKSMLCAGHLEGGIDACQGDSGGPLVCQHPGNGRWYQVGLTSWGKGCGLPNRPGVYTKLSKYLGWIEDQISRGKD